MDNQKIINTHLIICGETKVGKTSLANQLIYDTFNEEQSSTRVAITGTKDITLEDEDVIIRFVIEDTSGKQKFRAMNKLFYRIAEVVILIYDITSKQTFDEIKDYWLKEVNEHSINKKSKTILYYHNSCCNSS